MEPVTAIGLAATCGGIVTRISSTIKSLHDVRTKYKNSDRTVTYFILHLTTLRSASSRLAEWVDRNPIGRLSIGEQVDLQQSVDTCDALVEIVESAVTKSMTGPGGVFGFRSRVKFLWNEAEIRECREILQLQIQALMFQLQIIQLPTLAERSAARTSPAASVIDRARDEMSSFLEAGERNSVTSAGSLRTLGSDRSAGSARFIFEAILFNSGPYKRTLNQLGTRKSKATIPREENGFKRNQQDNNSTSSIDLVKTSSRIARMAALDGPNPPEEPSVKAKTSEGPIIPADRYDQKEQLSSFLDCYSKKDIAKGTIVSVVWSYDARAVDEWNLKRGDLFQITLLYDDGWAIAYKMDGTAENWEDADVSRSKDGEAKALPFVCVCLPHYWTNAIRGMEEDTPSA